MATPQRLPIVNSDDGTWGDILRQYLKKEHYDDGTDNPVNGGHQTITIRPGTSTAGTAPLKFSSGTLLASPETGAVEFNTDSLYFTITTGTTRKKVAIYDDSAGAAGDLYYRDSSGNFVRLGIGSNGQFLQVASGLPAWQSDPGTRVQVITAPAESAGPSSYPTGVSLTSVSSGSGWSLEGGVGNIITVVQSNNYTYQTFISANGGSSGLVKVYQRTYNSTSGWTSWAHMATPSDPSTMGITGEIKMWAASTIPSGWQLCDGSPISRTTYSALYSVIGTTYGAGDGSTTFNVPNLKGRVPVGYDSSQTEFNTIGGTGGEKTHTLTQAEMPSHTHTDSGHTHAAPDGGAFWVTSGSGANVANGTFWGVHTFDGTTNSTTSATANIQNTGGGGAHNNLQPYIALQYIIKL